MLIRLLSSLFVVCCLLNTARAESGNPHVLMQTNLGAIELELFAEQSPQTVENFLGYVDSGYYAGTVFHRVIAGFMIQGGGFDAKLNKKQTRTAIQNESRNGLSNRAGTIAMARTRAPHSATAQFFINSVNNPNLDARGTRYGYAVFGRVVKGMDLVKKISRLPTQPQGPHRDVPRDAVVIEKISRISVAQPQAVTPAATPAN